MDDMEKLKSILKYYSKLKQVDIQTHLEDFLLIMNQEVSNHTEELRALYNGILVEYTALAVKHLEEVQKLVYSTMSAYDKDQLILMMIDLVVSHGSEGSESFEDETDLEEALPEESFEIISGDEFSERLERGDFR